jgi:hypothetical protein
MGAFRESRNVELSLVYYLQTNINSDWSSVTTVKSFTNAYKAALPVVAVRLTDTINDRREVGSTTLLNDYILTIDVFGSSDGLRIDLADYIVDKLKDGCIYYEHSQTSGAPETLTRTNGNKRLIVRKFLSNQKLDFGEDVDNYDKFRHFIQVEIRIE